MTDHTVKQLLAFAVRNRENLCNLLSCFNAEDLEKGVLRIPERMINYDLKELILSKTAPYLEDYQVTLADGCIYLDGSANLTQLGALHAIYRLTITHLAYQPGLHTITCSYQEDVHSEGGFLQGMMMRAAGLSQGTYLKLASHLMKTPGVTVDQTPEGQDYFTIDLDTLYPFEGSFLNRFHLQYQDSQDGQLVFRFMYVD